MTDDLRKDGSAQIDGLISRLRGPQALRDEIAAHIRTLAAERDKAREVCSAHFDLEQHWNREYHRSQSRLLKAVEGLKEIDAAGLFRQQRFAEDTDADYFLRCFGDFKGRVRALLQSIKAESGGGEHE